MLTHYKVVKARVGQIDFTSLVIITGIDLQNFKKTILHQMCTRAYICTFVRYFEVINNWLLNKKKTRLKYLHLSRICTYTNT